MYKYYVSGQYSLSYFYLKHHILFIINATFLTLESISVFSYDLLSWAN
jgi:hypothetical protein